MHRHTRAVGGWMKGLTAACRRTVAFPNFSVDHGGVVWWCCIFDILTPLECISCFYLFFDSDSGERRETQGERRGVTRPGWLEVKPATPTLEYFEQDKFSSDWLWLRSSCFLCCCTLWIFLLDIPLNSTGTQGILHFIDLRPCKEDMIRCCQIYHLLSQHLKHVDAGEHFPITVYFTRHSQTSTVHSPQTGSVLSVTPVFLHILYWKQTSIISVTFQQQNENVSSDTCFSSSLREMVCTEIGLLCSWLLLRLGVPLTLMYVRL